MARAWLQLHASEPVRACPPAPTGPACRQVLLVQPNEEQLEELLDEVAPDRCVGWLGRPRRNPRSKIQARDGALGLHQGAQGGHMALGGPCPFDLGPLVSIAMVRICLRRPYAPLRPRLHCKGGRACTAAVRNGRGGYAACAPDPHALAFAPRWRCAALRAGRAAAAVAIAAAAAAQRQAKRRARAGSRRPCWPSPPRSSSRRTRRAAARAAPSPPWRPWPLRTSRPPPTRCAAPEWRVCARSEPNGSIPYICPAPSGAVEGAIGGCPTYAQRHIRHQAQQQPSGHACHVQRARTCAEQSRCAAATPTECCARQHYYT